MKKKKVRTIYHFNHHPLFHSHLLAQKRQGVSKEFRRINRLLGLTNKFHDLRHTFAVRRYLMNRDIYQVMRELGHTKVTTTQMYADFKNTVDIEKEFPSIVNTSNEPIFGIKNTIMKDTTKVDSLYVI